MLSLRHAAACSREHDPARSIDALTAALVRLLDEDGGLTDDLILAAAHEGEVAFLGQVLARRAGIPADVAIDGAAFGQCRSDVMALFRVAGVVARA